MTAEQVYGEWAVTPLPEHPGIDPALVVFDPDDDLLDDLDQAVA